MIVTRGGKEYQPSNDPAIIAPKQKDMSHAAFVLWETMIGLQLERKQAAKKWHRIEALQDKADANPDHPNLPRIYSRIQSLQSEILDHQVAFLKLEDAARREWNHLTQWEKREQGVCDMYHASEYVQLHPLWTTKLGESGEPAPFPMSTTALQLASPALIRVYQGGKR